MSSINKFFGNNLVALVTIFLFLSILPLSLKINFNQNDDWNRTITTKEFIKGNFQLRDETANTFYLQGLLGTAFYYITSSDRFALLTLLFSVLNFFVFAKIVNDFYVHNKYKAILFGLLFFLNPFHIYSIFGFMAENFYLFFLLVSVYFFESYRHEGKTVALITANVLSILGMFIKQVSIVTQLAFLVYLVVNKKLKPILVQLTFTLSSIVYYYFFFPRTGEMHTKDITVSNLGRWDFVFSLTWANLVYLVIFLLPIVGIMLVNTLDTKKPVNKRNLYTVLVIVAVGVGALFAHRTWFSPESIGSAEFPFIKNTFTRFGFFTINLHGTSYLFTGRYDLFNIWPTLAYLCVLILLGLVVVYNKKLHSPYAYFIAGYLLLMVMITEMFDRYLLPIYPMMILLYLNIVKDQKILQVSTIAGWVLFLGMLNYQYAMDFVYTNNYIWGKSKELMTTKGVPGEEISVNRAWKRIYPSEYHRTYYFSYDSPEVNEDFRNNYELLEVKKIDYPLNMHVNPNVYFYKYLYK